MTAEHQDRASSSAASVLMPCLAGYPAPVAAVYKKGLIRFHEWARESWPVAAAIWSDGTVVRSTDPYGFRSPYVIGRIPEEMVSAFLETLVDKGLLRADPSQVGEPSTDVEYVAVVAGRGLGIMTAKYRSSTPGSHPAPLPAPEMVRNAIMSLAESSTQETTATLTFDVNWLSCRQTTPVTSSPLFLPAEFRATWLGRDLLEEKEPESLDFLLQRLASDGFNTVCIPTQYRGGVVYPGSEFLYQTFVGDINANVLDWLLPAIHDKGLRAEAWMEYGFYAWHDRNSTDTLGPWLIRNPELAAIDREGRNYLESPLHGYFRILCPANPESHKLLTGLYLEALDRYPFDGIHLDRIRFPDENFCYCRYCRRQFQQDTGIELKVFAEGSPEWRKWMGWRQEQVTRFMELLSKTIRDRYPSVTITCSVVRHEQMEKKGQDWPTWLRRGYIDVAVPLLYSGGHIASGMEWIISSFSSVQRTRIALGLLPYAGVGREISDWRRAGGGGYYSWEASTTLGYLHRFARVNTDFGPGSRLLQYGRHTPVRGALPSHD